MIKLVSYLFLSFVAFIATSQELTQTIRGRVTDQQSGTPLIGATLLVADTDPLIGAVTDVEGYYEIKNVPVARQTLLVSSVGFQSKTIPEVMVGSGKQVVLDIQLIESVVQMNEVVVTAASQSKGEPQNELATVSAISFSVEETSRYAATFNDPARAALSYAGVSTGGDDLLNEIVIRGNSPKGMLWRLEGVEIPNPNHFAEIGSSAGGISMLSSNVLSNSDFFTGAFPAQYGNATSGIFDLNLRKGNFDEHEHAFQAGLLGIAAASEGPIAREKRSSYVANYRYSTLKLFDDVGLEILGSQEDVAFQDLSFKLHFPTEKYGSFSIWGLGGLNSYSYKPRPEIGDTWHEENDHGLAAAGVTHIGYIGNDTYVETVVSYNGYFINNLIDSMYVKLEEKENFSEGALRISSFINHKFNARHALRTGVIYSRINFNIKSQLWYEDEQSLFTILDDDGNATMIQGFANWQYRPANHITINSGVHMTHFSINNDTYLEPRLGFRWSMRKGSAITGGFGLHSRMESLGVYLAQQEQEDGSLVQHNTGLGFTRAFHAVLGYEKMLKDDLRFKSEVYYQQLYDVPIWGTDTTTDDFLRSFSALNTYEGYTEEKLQNGGTGRNYGIEFTLEKFFTDNYYFLTTASLYESKYQGLDRIERDTRFNGNYIFNALGGREFDLGKNRRININGRFILSGGKRDAPILLDQSRLEGRTVRDHSRAFELKYDDYWRVDLGISYRKDHPAMSSVVSINIQNVTGKANEYGRFYSEEVDRIVTASQIGMFPNLSYRVEF